LPTQGHNFKGGKLPVLWAGPYTKQFIMLRTGTPGNDP